MAKSRNVRAFVVGGRRAAPANKRILLFTAPINCLNPSGRELISFPQGAVAWSKVVFAKRIGSLLFRRWLASSCVLLFVVEPSEKKLKVTRLLKYGFKNSSN